MKESGRVGRNVSAKGMLQYFNLSVVEVKAAAGMNCLSQRLGTECGLFPSRSCKYDRIGVDVAGLPRHELCKVNTYLS